MNLIILDLCGGTGAWSKPYQEHPDVYDVRLITLPEKDVRLLEVIENVHGILAAPPCTSFAGSGARWWKEKGGAALLEGLAIVDACLRIIAVSKPKWWVLENPVGRLRRWIGPPVFIFNPCDYAGYLKNPDTDLYTKKTCLWGNFNIPKKKLMKPILGSKMHRLPPGKERFSLRSITPAGFAYAFFLYNQ